PVSPSSATPADSPTRRSPAEAGDTMRSSRPYAAAVLAVLAVCVAVVAVGPANPATAAAGDIRGTDSGAAIPDQYLVVLKDTATMRANGMAASARSLVDTYRGRLGHVYDQVLNGFATTMTEADARRLAADPRVDHVTQDQYVQTADTDEGPADWGLDRID